MIQSVSQSDSLSILRGHLHSVTCMEYIYVPQNSTATGKLKPTLLSSDSKGWLIWWDLFTRRPIAVWKGHDDNIATIKQMGITWSFEQMGNTFPDYSVDDKLFGLVITHSKDSKIKIWDLFRIEDHGLKLSCPNISSKLPSSMYKFSSSAETLQEYPQPTFEIITVNALNFCNIDVFEDKIITTNKVDSNNFDLYQVFRPRDDIARNNILSRFNLTIKLKGIDPSKVFEKSFKMNGDVEFEINEQASVTKKDKFGIMMRVMFVNENTFYIGYESGHLLGFELAMNREQDVVPSSQKVIRKVDVAKHSNLSKLFSSNKPNFVKENGIQSRTVINKDPTLKLIYVNRDHFPNPILSMSYDESKEILFTGSTGKKLVLHDVKKSSRKLDLTSGDTNIKNLRHNGVSSLSVRTDGLLAVSFWDGYARIYKSSESLEDICEIDKIARPSPKIAFETPNPRETNNQELRKKLNFLSFSRISKEDEISVGIERRESKNMRKHFLALAYEDGFISLYNYKIN